MSCPPGYSNDNILRLPAWVGPLNEPLGSDCLKHDLAFAVISWILIALGIVTLFVSLTEVFAENVLLATRVTYVFQVALWIDIIVFLLLAMYKPEGCFAAWFVFCFLLWMSMLCMIRIGLSSNAQTIAKVTHKSVLQVLGGPVAVGFYVFLTMVCFTAVMVGSCGTAVYVAQGDVETAKAFWSLHCMGYACYVCVAITIGTALLRRFANLVEEVAQNARDLRVGSGSGNGTLAGLSVEDIVLRFRKSGKMAWAALPLGCGAWIVHAFVLPVFWYLVLMHLCNAAFMTYLIYFLYTPLSRRQKLVARFKALLPSGWMADSTASQAGSARGGNNKLGSGVLSSSSAAQVAADVSINNNH